jgi:hypothetical protein
MIFTKHYASFYLFVFGSAHLSFDCLLGISRQYVLKKWDREQEALTAQKSCEKKTGAVFIRISGTTKRNKLLENYGAYLKERWGRACLRAIDLRTKRVWLFGRIDVEPLSSWLPNRGLPLSIFKERIRLLVYMYCDISTDKLAIIGNCLIHNLFQVAQHLWSNIKNLRTTIKLRWIMLTRLP